MEFIDSKGIERWNSLTSKEWFNQVDWTNQKDSFALWSSENDAIALTCLIDCLLDPTNTTNNRVRLSTFLHDSSLPLSIAALRSVLARHHRVITLVRLQRQLLQRLELLFAQLLHLSGKHGLRRGGGVDAAGLDGDHAVPARFQKVLRVDSHDTRLVRLRHIREDRVHHAHQHAVLQRMARILDDRNDVRTRLRHIDQITTRTMGELHRVDETGLEREDRRKRVRDPRYRRREIRLCLMQLPDKGPCYRAACRYYEYHPTHYL